ncbi:MAG: hypothetical protein ACPG2Y_00280, partial [Acholeplasmataceae bacterium]
IWVDTALEDYDWSQFYFKSDKKEIDKLKGGITQKDLLKTPFIEQNVTTQHEPPTAQSAPVRNTNSSETSLNKYLLNEQLIHDAESIEIVKLLWDCYQYCISAPCAYQKTPVLSTIMTIDPDGNLTSSAKLIMQMLLDITQIQLQIEPLTVQESCKTNYTLLKLWDQLSRTSQETAQALLHQHQKNIDWFCSELWQTYFVHNLVHSDRYQVNDDSWVDIGLESMDGTGFFTDEHLSGIWIEGKPFSFNQIMVIIDELCTLVPKYPLVVLRGLSYIIECIFYYLTDENLKDECCDVLKLMSKVYAIGNQMDWSWLIDIINGISIDAVQQHYATQSNLSCLVDAVCVVASAWCAFGKLGAFDPNKLIKNHELTQLWNVFIVCALVSMHEKIEEIEQDLATLDQLFNMFVSKNTGTCFL